MERYLELVWRQGSNSNEPDQNAQRKLQPFLGFLVYIFIIAYSIVKYESLTLRDLKVTTSKFPIIVMTVINSRSFQPDIAYVLKIDYWDHGITR